jgi:DNA (cytosine-5)-methyltransferase 1
MHYCRLIQELGPKVFVMENVSGMVKGTMKGKFIEIVTQLKSMNYEVKCKLMNAMYYGVPQARERVIFIGVRKDLNKHPTYPKPSKNVISVKQALDGLDDIGFYPEIKNDFLKSILGKIRPGESASKYHENQSYFNVKRIQWNQPSYTLTKTFSGFIHPKENRFISINEAKRICSFPDSWQLGDDFNEAFARLGNAVMPKFMQAIAETIKTQILNSPRSNTHS